MNRLALVPVLFALTACSGTDGVGEGDSGADGLDAGTQAMLDQTEADISGHESWAQLANWTGINESGGAHGAFVDVRWNSIALEAIEAGNTDPMPIGSIITKQGYEEEAGTTKVNLTVMNKVDGYGWFWASWDAEGNNLVAGSPDYCISCHTPGTDFRLAE